MLNFEYYKNLFVTKFSNLDLVSSEIGLCTSIEEFRTKLNNTSFSYSYGVCKIRYSVDENYNTFAGFGSLFNGYVSFINMYRTGVTNKREMTTFFAEKNGIFYFGGMPSSSNSFAQNCEFIIFRFK